MATPPAQSRTTLAIEPSRAQLGNARPPANHSADQVFQGIESCVARAASELNSIKSPQSQYEDDVAKLQSSLQNVWSRYATADAHDRAKIQDEVKCHHIDLYLLESNYKSNLEQATSAYEQQTEVVVQRLCDKLIATLGPSRIKHTLRDLEPQRLYDHLPGDKFASAVNGAQDVHSSTTPEASPNVPQSHDKNSITTATSPPRRGVKRRYVNTTSSHRAAKRPAIAQNGPRLSRRQRNRQIRDYGGNDHGQHAPPEEVIPGEVYLVWERSKMWSVVLLLPTDAIDSVGVPETMETLGLSSNLPDCYVVDTRSKTHETYEWGDDYKDGGPRVAERVYPVMDFDGSKRPKKRARWLAASELKAYDEEIARSLDYYPQIQEYLQRRLLEGRSGGDRTIFVRGDASHSLARSEAVRSINSSDSEASALDCARSLSASGPLPATRETTVPEEAAVISSDSTLCAESNQESVRSRSVPKPESSRENSLQRHSNGLDRYDEYSTRRSPSLGTEGLHSDASTQERDHEVATCAQAVGSPLPVPVTGYDLMAQSAVGSLHEKVSGGDSLAAAQAADCPIAGTTQELITPAHAVGDGLGGKSTHATCSTLLRVHPPETPANRSSVGELGVAERTDSAALSTEPHGPHAQPWNAGIQRALSFSRNQPMPSPASTKSTQQPDAIRNHSPAGVNDRQPTSGHILPPVAEALGSQSGIMHESLPPIRTHSEDIQWPTRPLMTSSYNLAGPLAGDSNQPATRPNASCSVQTQFPGQSVSILDPSMEVRVITPGAFQGPAYKGSGGWPADFPEVLVRELEGVFRRRTGLPDDFKVSANHFRYGDKYHCPFCSEGKRKSVTVFFKHLKGSHCSSA